MKYNHRRRFRWWSAREDKGKRVGVVYFILELSEHDIFVVFRPPMIYAGLKLRKRTPPATTLFPLSTFCFVFLLSFRF